MAFSINIDNFPTTSPYATFQFNDMVARFFADMGPALVDAIKSRTPIVTGRLKDSTYYTVEEGKGTAGGNSMQLVIHASAPEAAFVLGGTAPHIIRPSAALALHWHDTGGEHFARIVHHPGTKPNDYVSRAWSAVEENAMLLFERYTGSAILGNK